MPRRGRLPKPDALKKAQGNPGRRRLTKPEALAPAPTGPLAPPVYLTPAERKVWESQIGVLESLKFIRPSDLKAFGRFVKFQALFESVAGTVTADNLVEVTVSDKVTMERLNKRFLALLHIDKRLLAYDAEFGTTPSGRQSLLARLASRPAQLQLDPQSAPATSSDETIEVPAPSAATLVAAARAPSPVGLGRVH